MNLSAGDLYVIDCREPPPQSTAHEQSAPVLKIVQWNVERGYQIDKITALLLEQNADIIALQELDVECDRSHGRNCVLEIAQALKMKCAFLVEFEELRSPLRSDDSQGGGVHGNAILSKYDFEPYVVAHTYHPIDWAVDGSGLGEPRRGCRAVLAASICIPGLSNRVLCYCLHLEVFTGIIGRLKQFRDVLADSHRQRREGRHLYQMILGDLNTMAHSIARLSPNYCRDFLRMWSIGQSEGAFWDRHLFHVLHDDLPNPNQKLLPLCPRHFSFRELCDLRNSYFYDPFLSDADMTLSNYYGIYQGKLDWCLFRGFFVQNHGMDNLDYSASDHRLLYALIRPEICKNKEMRSNWDPGPFAYESYYKSVENQHWECQNRRKPKANRSFVILDIIYDCVLESFGCFLFFSIARTLLLPMTPVGQRE